MRRAFFILVCLIVSSKLNGQIDSSALMDFEFDRRSINRNGMTVLGTWATLNIGWSLSQMRNSSPSLASYHQMNFAWNLVNLGIAGFAWYQASLQPTSIGLSSILEAQYSIEKVLAVNTALDLAYILGGAYLQEYAQRSNNTPRYQGFGKAVIVNGSFLLLFDLSMYLIHWNHNTSHLQPLLENLKLGPNGIGLHWTF